MPLTPEDVSNKRFTPVRLREGYDMGEVDQFLDEVEAELARLTKENDDLRAKLGAAQAGGPVPRSRARPGGRGGPSREPEPEPEPAPGRGPGAGETIRVETVPEASNAAARLLEIATRNADELVGGQTKPTDHGRGPHQGRALEARRPAVRHAKADARPVPDARESPSVSSSSATSRRSGRSSTARSRTSVVRARVRAPTQGITCQQLPSPSRATAKWRPSVATSTLPSA